MNPLPRIPYRFQPQVPVSIDWSHPISRGLVFYYLPSQGSVQAPRELIKNRLGTQVGTVLNSLNGGGKGKTLPWNLATSYWFARDVALEPPNNLTIMAFVKSAATLAQFSRPLGKTFNDNLTPFASYTLALASNVGGADINDCTFFWCQGGALQNTTAFALHDVTKPTLITATVTTPSVTGGAIVYENGVARTSSNTVAGGISYDTTTTGNLMVSGSKTASPGANFWAGEIYMAAVWNRVLSPAEVKQMSDGSPFQILTPLRAPQFPVRSPSPPPPSGPPPHQIFVLP